MLFEHFYYKAATILYHDGSYSAGMIMQRNHFEIGHFLSGGTEKKESYKVFEFYTIEKTLQAAKITLELCL